MVDDLRGGIRDCWSGRWDGAKFGKRGEDMAQVTCKQIAKYTEHHTEY